jgi:hypothetical protein
MKMKKIISFLAVMVFALTFGLAFAEDSTTKTKDMSATNGYLITAMANGITVFDSEPAELSAEGSGAGGAALEEYTKLPYNGITVFDLGPVEVGAEGSAAGGLRAEEPSMEVSNGITIFHTTVSFD